ncbi:MAG: hypothetical protein GY772_14330 [bacterium]|nr:hypothetical protein [bacterium]
MVITTVMQVTSSQGEYEVEVDVELDVEVTTSVPAEAASYEHPGAPAELEVEATLGSDVTLCGARVWKRGDVFDLSESEHEEICERLRRGE